VSSSKRRGDTSGTLIFPGEPLAPAQHLGRRSAPQGTHAVGISVDHPLSFPSDAPAHYPSNRPSQPATKPTGFAGKASGVEVPRLQRSEPRHQYEPPTYQIRRTPADSGTKDLLYGSAPSIPKAPAAPQGHPLSSAYEWLAALVPTLPRDAEGNADEPHVRACLSEAGIDISEDGLAEMLARCDVSPTGFPPFSDFLLCLSRPHRELPPSAQPVVMGGESALPDRYKPATPAEQSMGSAPPPDEKSAGPTGPPPLPRAPAMPMSDEEMQQTWRHMQMKKEMQPQTFLSTDVYARHATPVHGIASKRDHEMAAHMAGGQAGQAAGDQWQMRQQQQMQMPPQQQMQMAAQHMAVGQSAAACASVVGGSMAGALDNPAELALKSAIKNGSTARLGVEPSKPTPSFPLGARSQVTALGNNYKAMYSKTRHASSQKFTNSFPADAHFF